tara:strand:- start:886 stop:1419 length:534 start_codon:yes stop_codon:yes gene_type:complete
MERKEPWLTTDAIIHLKRVMEESKNLKILEFGSGSSTVWFANNYECELVSIEHDANWHKMVCENIRDNKNITLILKPSGVIGRSDLLEHSYAPTCETFEDNYFDIVLIDGRSRVDCFKYSERVLKEGGLMILDNSERIEYSYIMEIYKDKTQYNYPQIGADKYNFNYPGWATTIWVK